MDKNWKDKDTIRFLKLYEKEKCLWNYKHENYRNQSARKAAVSKIVKGMNKPKLTDSEVRNKIRNIRSTYAQELAKFIRALKDGRKDYMSSLVWFPMAHNFLRKVVASKSLENTDSNSVCTSETQVVESENAKVKKPPMVGDPPICAENSENSNDSPRPSSPFVSSESSVDENIETIETSNIEDSQMGIAPQNVLNEENLNTLQLTNSDNAQAEVVQMYYLEDILNAANAKIETSNNDNYQVVEPQNTFYLKNSLNLTGQIAATPISSKVQVLRMQTPFTLPNSPNPISNIKISNSNKVKILQVQRPTFFPSSVNNTVIKGEVATPNSNNLLATETQSPIQTSTSTRKRKKVDTPNSDNLQSVEEQNPASSPNFTKPKRKRKTKEPNTAQAQETTRKDFIQDEFFYFAQNVASQLRELPLKSALLCQAKILETIVKERIAVVEKISTAPAVLPLVDQHSKYFSQIANTNGDYWESDHSVE